jgi:hypothetical protein
MCDGKDGNAVHYEESQKCGVSATIRAVFYRKDFFTTDIWLLSPIPKHIDSVKIFHIKNSKFPKIIG